MTIPNFLVMEIRAAFRSCAQQHRASNRAYFSLTTQQLKQHPPRSAKGASTANWPYNGALPPPTSSNSHPPSHTGSRSRNDTPQTDLVPQQKDPNAISTERKVPVPLRVIPKAEIAPNVRLSPRERLHIEVLTRQQPRSKEEKIIYRERLQIYHMGAFKENVLAVLKISAIASACAVTFVIAPAHLNAGSEWWLVTLIWLGGFIPLFAINYATKSMVSRIFLDLPAKARETSKAALEYARNLPRDADLDIRYLQPWALEGSIKARISEFEPAKGNLLRPLSFKWIDKFKKQPPNRFSPTSFFVYSKTAAGEKSKNTIPGIWESVYKQLMRNSDTTDMARWGKQSPPVSSR